ncbi:TetR/AcrR family transcriptional regulator [Cohnella sp. GCM10012308]|uniref:TetR/AcrR family transcriptional regulator n=1 Tax=Cohnella sp. GCM10012308 TaxID=3317329 RepID=UPI0036097965
MARSKAFEPSQALDKAMKLFWRNGYERTSVGDLIAAMGINRGSLYDTFGDKQALYEGCLNRYSEVYASRIVNTLSQPLPVYPTLRRLFDNVVDLVHEDRSNWGCLMANTASELSLHDDRAAELVKAHFLRLEQAFTAFLERGMASGELAADLDARAYGRTLTVSFTGLATLAKTQVPRDFLKDVVETALQPFQ